MTIDKFQVSRQFSRAASQYDRFAIVQSEMADRLLAGIKDGAAGKLVDLGCGTGAALARIQNRTKLSLTGIDLAPEMLKIAKSRVPTASFIIGDLERTQLKTNVFDFVFSNAALQWCNLSAALKEMNRLLRPGGKLLLATFGDGTLAQWENAWLAVNPNHRRVHEFPNAMELENQLRHAGFSSIELQSSTRTFTFESVDKMIASVRRIGATYADNDRAQTRLTRAMYQRFREAASDSSTGQAQLSYQCLSATATA